MSSRKMILIFALPLLAACADREPFAPNTEDTGAIQAAKGGNKGKPGGGGDGDSFSYTLTDLGKAL